MADIKLTKNELKVQQYKLNQLERYLPTLQLKKAMLLLEVQSVKENLQSANSEYAYVRTEAASFMPLLVDSFPIELKKVIKIALINKGKDNIAGVEVPVFKSIQFEDLTYSYLATPVWTEIVIHKLRELITAQVKMDVLRERKEALEKEAREVSKRVNLFEKILIPRACTNIKKIKVYLSDMQLAQVSRAKVAKRLIEAKTLCA